MYPLLVRKEFAQGNYKIVPIRDQDKFEIMQWRNDQIDVLRQSVPLTREMQTRYFKEVVMRELKINKPNQILFSYLCNDILIGYGGLVHINWIDRRGEVSFLLDSERNSDTSTFKHDYAVYLSLIKQLAFEELKFNKLTTEAYDIRPYLIETLEANGFVCEGVLKKHNWIQGRYVNSILHACFS